MNRVLVVDDEPQIRRALRTSLEAHGYEVESVGTGEEARRSAPPIAPDLVLLDLGLPDLDGTEVIRRGPRRSRECRSSCCRSGTASATRSRRSTPVRTTTSRSRSAMEELLARARAAMRRAQPGEPPRALMRSGVARGRPRDAARDARRRPLRLTPTEYRLLEAIATNPGKLLTHQWLLRRVWGQGYGTETTYLRTYVRALRKKLGDDAAAPQLIVTEPGVGYRWIAEGFGRRVVASDGCRRRPTVRVSAAR